MIFSISFATIATIARLATAVTGLVADAACFMAVGSVIGMDKHEWTCCL